MIERICSLHTKNVKSLGVVRVLLGLLFVGTGSMKFLVPMLWTAWSGQLTQARIPFYAFNLHFVPIVEIVTGLLLIVGLFSRVGGLVVVAMMAVATYVHLVVDDPTLFPLQPEEPVIPMVALAMTAYIVWRGGGAWSLDLKASRRMVSSIGHIEIPREVLCSRLRPTYDRPGSQGTYIVRLSRANSRRLVAENGAYLEVGYGTASVLACLSIDDSLDDETILMDQTIRMAICLGKSIQNKNEMVFNPDGAGGLSHPIAIRRWRFGRPRLMSRLFKQQYLVCLVHHALAVDMEKPIVRINENAMDVINLGKRDRVFLMSEDARTSVRCLPLPSEIRLPMESMQHFNPPCPGEAYAAQTLPWITMDSYTRRLLNVDPWEPIFVGADIYRIVAREAALLGTIVGVTVGLSQFVPKQISMGNTIITNVPLALVIAGFVIGTIFMWVKVRSRV